MNLPDIEEFLNNNITCTYRHLECDRVQAQIVFIHNIVHVSNFSKFLH